MAILYKCLIQYFESFYNKKGNNFQKNNFSYMQNSCPAQL